MCLNSVNMQVLLSQPTMCQFRCDILAIFDIHLHTCNIIFYFIFFVIASSLAHPTRCLHYQDKTAVAPCSNCTKSQPLRRRTCRARSTSRWYCKQIEEVNVEYSIISIYSSAAQPFSITYQSGTQTTLEFR